MKQVYFAFVLLKFKRLVIKIENVQMSKYRSADQYLGEHSLDVNRVQNC